MPDAVPVALAKAIKTEMDAAKSGWTMEPTVERHYAIDFESKDFKDLKAIVVPRKEVIDPFDRGGQRNNWTVDVAIAKHTTDKSAAAIDPLMFVVEEITDHFVEKRELAVEGTSFLIRPEASVVFSSDHLAEVNVFFSLLSLTYAVFRDFP